VPHEPALITTIAAAFGLALIPGFVADIELRQQLAEIGVMLLIFGVGLHFSLADLLAVRRIALPGAVAQIAAAASLSRRAFRFG
jgi:CPA2 family monovalent cation:H+ antiporter-2